MILIVGDYEEVSQAIARQLLDAGLEVRLLADRPVSAHLLAAGAQIALRRADAPASVGSAFDGVERVCLAACRDDLDARLQLACLSQAGAAGVRRVVKISGERPDPQAHGGPALDAARDADRTVEGAVRHVDRPWTIVRHAPLFQDMAWLAGASVHAAAGVPAVLVAPLDANDVAMVTIDYLVDDDLGSSVERVTGPSLIALEECLGQLRLVAGRGAGTERPEASRLWRRPLDRDWAPEVEEVSDAVARVTGEPPLSFGEFVSALAGASLGEEDQP